MTETPRGLIEELVRRHRLGGIAGERLQKLCGLLTDPAAPTALHDPGRIVLDHLADALVALELEPVRQAGEIADVGSGAGVPGLPLAIALPSAAVALVESNRRKCAFLDRAVRACKVPNARVVNARAEDWREGLESVELVTARAVGPLALVVEYAAPLLVVGGRLVAWRGMRDPEAESIAALAAERLAMEPLVPQPVEPYRGARKRHLHVFVKRGATPAGFPRRPGVARKRPLGF